ncbi:SDR family oxidoreductase [Methylomonas sp. EFPC1]|uniref:SDR family oxidoreductase n=1 Tax=unclassified Methylomonas TaxID=2608980 RepID=UPI00051C1095|nr:MULTISPECIES: SDR family oxidoreductase [unclassified Methylomonas]QBC28913.1 SDR family oxidoreductase [Methylomonas sp. LW13]QSB00515.1 SDR family oxidoreductase [Methylomonas sp. EFPC1]
MQTVLITGANRGLGLEFCRQYAAADYQVIAACRKPDQAEHLAALAKQYSHIQIETLDVADFNQIDALASKLADCKIDVLLNNAGVYGDQAGRGLGQLDYQTWENVLAVNVMAPLKLAEAFLPQVQRGDKRLIVALSSLMGSMTDNTSGGSILYRSSKAALNAALKSLSIDLRPSSIGVLILHPGWVRTDMGGPNGLIDVEESVSGMRKVIANFSLADSGSFVKYDGSALPW